MVGHLAQATHARHAYRAIQLAMNFRSHQFRLVYRNVKDSLFGWRVWIYRFYKMVSKWFFLGRKRTRLIFMAVRNLCFCSSWLSSDRLRNEAFAVLAGGTRWTCWPRCETPPPTFCIIVKRSFIDSVVVWILSIDDMIGVRLFPFSPLFFYLLCATSISLYCYVCAGYFYARLSRSTCARVFVWNALGT